MSEDGDQLKEFNRQLENVEQMLREADIYNDKLAAQIDNVKEVVKCNQLEYEELQSNERHIKFLLEEDSYAEELYAKVIKHVNRLERKLFVSLSLFDGLKNQESYKDHSSKAKVSLELGQLGALLISTGNEILLLRQDISAAEHIAKNLLRASCKGPSNKSKKCWTHCTNSMQDNLQFKQLEELQKQTKSLSQAINYEDQHSIREIRAHQRIIQRVEAILARAQELNIKSEALRNVKILSKMILRALVKRNQLHKICCIDNIGRSQLIHNLMPTIQSSREDCQRYSRNPYIE